MKRYVSKFKESYTGIQAVDFKKPTLFEVDTYELNGFVHYTKLNIISSVDNEVEAIKSLKKFSGVKPVFNKKLNRYDFLLNGYFEVKLVNSSKYALIKYEGKSIFIIYVLKHLVKKGEIIMHHDLPN